MKLLNRNDFNKKINESNLDKDPIWDFIEEDYTSRRDFLTKEITKRLGKQFNSQSGAEFGGMPHWKIVKDVYVTLNDDDTVSIYDKDLEKTIYTADNINDLNKLFLKIQKFHNVNESVKSYIIKKDFFGDDLVGNTLTLKGGDELFDVNGTDVISFKIKDQVYTISASTFDSLI